MMFKPGAMRGQRILVTGGGTGLGKVMAEGLLMLGAEVYICGRRGGVLEESRQEELTTPMARAAARCIPVACDIRVPEAIHEMMEQVWADGGLR